MGKQRTATTAVKRKRSPEDDKAFQQYADNCHAEFLRRQRARYSTGAPAPFLLSNLEYFTDSLEQFAAVGHQLSASNNDVDMARRTATSLWEASRRFYDYVGKISDSKTQAAIISIVDDIFTDAMAVGAFSRYLPDFHQGLMDKKRTQNARDARARISPTEHRRTKIKECYKTEHLVDSEKFAESIRTELNAKFEPMGIKPISARTIRRDIQAILKGHSDRVRKK